MQTEEEDGKEIDTWLFVGECSDFMLNVFSGEFWIQTLT